MPALAPLYSLTDVTSLLSAGFTAKPSPDQATYQVMAEMLLGLASPAYTGDDAKRLAYAVALQINYQLERGVSPESVRSSGNAQAGNTTTYRDRAVHSGARQIVEQVTGVRQVRYEPFATL
jgi:hypothetical protein